MSWWYDDTRGPRHRQMEGAQVQHHDQRMSDVERQLRDMIGRLFRTTSRTCKRIRCTPPPPPLSPNIYSEGFHTTPGKVGSVRRVNFFSSLTGQMWYTWDRPKDEVLHTQKGISDDLASKLKSLRNFCAIWRETIMGRSHVCKHSP